MGTDKELYRSIQMAQ